MRHPPQQVFQVKNQTARGLRKASYYLRRFHSQNVDDKLLLILQVVPKK
jgi:hypothetical protein